ncbi:hypothetical protein MTR_7g007830 [Medicago truncatula]|uniref:Uncharacterized protein n=1 Tax=Medicago truncatula TaxID=3880 RepID=A0A072TXI1_MEDTR|nr:hypothetical protein MTR_7g007830 [Medicago truncatula]
MLQLNSTSSPRHRHKTSTKRRSMASSSSERRAKKHSFDQDDLTNNGFSAISLPFSVCGNDLRRCVSTPEKTTAPPEQSNLPAVKEAGLPPLALSLRRSLSADVSQALDTPLPPNLRRSLSADVSQALNTEETTTVDSLRLKRMKDRLREMRQWWDELMNEEEEKVEEQQEEVEELEQKEESPVSEEEKVLSQLQITKPQSPVAEEYNDLPQDGCCEDFEEAVSVEWAEKCISLTFKCPCGKGYEVLISANNCYYKLV